MRDETKLLKATLGAAAEGAPLHEGPVFAGPFRASGDASAAAYTYGRSHNPTWTAVERAIAGLEGAGSEVRLFGSGMAAVAAVFGALLREGDVVVMPRGSYFLAAKLLEERFVARGVTVRTVAAGEMATAEAVRGARLVWVETPSNPELEITDIAAVVAAAKAEGVLVAVDNTTATPLAQRPLELGADVSVSSDSKMMCGHSDVLLGHVAARDAELVAQIDRERTLTGGIAGPMEAWLLLRSLATLPLRLERSSDNAQQVAEFLAGRKGVSGVVYPGLKGHPGHEVARRQMRYFGPVVGFALESQAAAERFLQRAELVTECTSFGGVTTTAERRRRWGHDAVPEGFIRMSVGCEAVEDLLGDFERALR